MVVRVHRWVAWWFFLGVFGGIVGLVNIFVLDLTRYQERVILLIGIVHWLLGAIVCWAWEGVKLGPSKQKSPAHGQPANSVAQEEEQNIAVELLTHRNRVTSPRHSAPRQEMLTIYLLHHWHHS